MKLWVNISKTAKLRINLFADDAAIFLNPVCEEVQMVRNILDAFASVSGLTTNTSKSAAYPVKCEGLDLQHILEPFQCPIKEFPCTYLGLPLHVRQVRRVDAQPLIDKVGKRLQSWKGKLLSRAGR